MTDTHQTDAVQGKHPMLIAALGVVFGDIGTSPIYALRESFAGRTVLQLDLPNLLGVLSLILWALVLVVSVKYLLFVLRANNHGEGGIIALVALLNPVRTEPGATRYLFMVIGLFGACLLYGDGSITPAISILSAVEGLRVAAPQLSHFVIPITVVILVSLFALQSQGSSKIGHLFGPVMLLWFIVLAGLGLRGIIMEPIVLTAFNPYHGIAFFANNGLTGFLTLGAVFLVVTGGEALYADLGHFGVTPIRRAWFMIVFPALALNYMGQSALLIHRPAVVTAPFIHMAPGWAALPLVILATAASIIASQAVISGTFSLTRQAIRLGQLPRMRIIFTQPDQSGQVYLPLVNWLLMGACVALVLGFRSSNAMASAYGVAVSMDMLVTSILAIAVARRFNWHPLFAIAAGSLFVVIDSAFLGANLVKIPDGGWYVLLVAGFIFLLMWSWRAGRASLEAQLSKHETSQEAFLQLIKSHPPYRVSGTAVVLTSHDHLSIPAALTHHLACTHTLHERVIFLTVITDQQPHVPSSKRLEFQDLGQGIMRMQTHYGFSQPPNIPVALKFGDHLGIRIDTDAVIYVVGRKILTAKHQLSGLRYWQKIIFIWLARNAAPATTYYQLPENQVLEIGSRITL